MSRNSIRGGCYCGAIRYELTEPPRDRTNCHCSNCRRAVGAQSVAWVTVNKAHLLWERGSPTRYRTDTAAWRSFCPACGTSLTYERDDRPGEIDVTAGSLDHPEDFPPLSDFYQEEKLPWTRLAGGN